MFESYLYMKVGCHGEYTKRSSIGDWDKYFLAVNLKGGSLQRVKRGVMIRRVKAVLQVKDHCGNRG